MFSLIRQCIDDGVDLPVHFHSTFGKTQIF